MKISVITICYNDPDIEKTCESVVNQSFQDFEWIVIDGGSNSQTIQRLNKYRNRMNIFVSEKDNGVYNAMNKGIKAAKGEYLQFLNAGDCYYENESLRNAYENLTGEDLVYGDLKYEQGEKTFIKKSPDKIPYGWFRKECLPHPSTFIKKELFEKYGTYNEKYNIVSDFEKWIQWIDVYNCSYKHIPYIISIHNFNGRSSVADEEHINERTEVVEKYYGTKKYIKLFKIPLLKILKTKKETKCYLFGFIPMFTSKARKMKLGVSYNLFDAEELLPFSAKSIRSSVDYINVIYQTTSNFGQQSSSDLEEKLKQMQKEGLIDEIFHYQPNLKLTAQKNEIKKRNIGLNLAKKNKCTHFMSLDVDEFYEAQELNNAKEFIIKKKIDYSAVSLVEYIKTPTLRLIEGYTFTFENDEKYNFQVPFIINLKKNPFCRHGKSFFPVLTDPTRRVNAKGKFYLFPVQEIVMHHMSSVRKDLEKKFSNSSFMNSPPEVQKYVNNIKEEILNFDFEQTKISGDYALFGNKLVKKVENKFGINFD